jgi:hypothetical protein
LLRSCGGNDTANESSLESGRRAPLDENARRAPLAAKTIRLHRDHIHSAISAAVAAGVDSSRLVELGSLTAPETFKQILRHRWESEGRKLTAYTHGLAGSLIAIGKEWVRAPNDALAALKATRHRLGTLPIGLTEKNKDLLRQFNDKGLLRRLVNLMAACGRRIESVTPTIHRSPKCLGDRYSVGRAVADEKPVHYKRRFFVASFVSNRRASQKCPSRGDAGRA